MESASLGLEGWIKIPGGMDIWLSIVSLTIFVKIAIDSPGREGSLSGIFESQDYRYTSINLISLGILLILTMIIFKIESTNKSCHN